VDNQPSISVAGAITAASSAYDALAELAE